MDLSMSAPLLKPNIGEMDIYGTEAINLVDFPADARAIN